MIAPLVEPLGPEPGQWYWMEYAQAMGMAAEMRVGEGLVLLRYDTEHDHLTAFTARFAGRLEGLNLYAMAARQVDPLTEVPVPLAGGGVGDGTNGKAYVEGRLDDVASYDFGECLVGGFGNYDVNMFEAYRSRAVARVRDLRRSGMTNGDVATYLYGHRNAIAHGRTNTLLHDFGSSMEALSGELPLVKLLSRMAVEDA